MDKEAILKETYNSAFDYELEKLSGMKSWLATGTGVGSLLGGGIGGASGVMSAKQGEKLKGALIGAGIGAGAGALTGGGAGVLLGKKMPTILRNRKAKNIRNLKNLGKEDFSRLTDQYNKASDKGLKYTGLDKYTDRASVIKNTEGVHRGIGANSILRGTNFRGSNPSKNEYPSFKEVRDALKRGPKRNINDMINMENKTFTNINANTSKDIIADLVKNSPRFRNLNAEKQSKVYESLVKMRNF